MKHLKSSENKKSKIKFLFGMLLLIGALLISTKLVQKAQDTRSSAASCKYGSKKCFGTYLGTCKQTSINTYWSKSPCRYGCSNNKCNPNPAKITPTKEPDWHRTATVTPIKKVPIKTETPTPTKKPTAIPTKKPTAIPTKKLIVVNGFCGTRKNGCDKGDWGDVTDTVDYIKWKCIGKNGGTTMQCKMAY